MTNAAINDLYIRLSKTLKNDQKYPYSKIGALIVACTSGKRDINEYFEAYPPLVDVAELGAALEYDGTSQPEELLTQIHYKLRQLAELLPDVAE
jgi:hypothetical protein